VWNDISLLVLDEAGHDDVGGDRSRLRSCRGIECSSLSRLCSEGNLRSGAPDRTMAASGHDPLEGIVFGVGRGWRVMCYVGAMMERLRLAQNFYGDVKSCLADRYHAESCMFGR
jgi:hypothetical protein